MPAQDLATLEAQRSALLQQFLTLATCDRVALRPSSDAAANRLVIAPNLATRVMMLRSA